MSAVVKFFKKVIKTVGYFFTGTYEGTEGNDNIYAASINLGWGDGILTKGGNDKVTAAAFNLKVQDTWGDLTVYGAGGYTRLYKSGNGNLTFYGASGGLKVEHTGDTGNLNLRAVAASSTALRRGVSGNIDIWSAAAHTSYKLFTKTGNIVSRAISAYLNLERRSNGHANSTGDTKLYGAGAYVKVYSDVDNGSIEGYTASGNGTFKRYGKNSKVDLKLAGINNEVYHHSTTGDTKIIALGGRNYIEKKGRAYGDNSRGNLDAKVVGLRNNIIHETKYGNTTVYGGAVSSKITRRGYEGNAKIYGLGVDNEINIQMKKGHLEYIGAAASNRITIKGYKKVSAPSRTISVESTGAYLGEGLKFIATLPDDFKSGDTIWAKFKTSVHIKGVKLKLEFKDNLVKATAIQAKYITGSDLNYDFEKGGNYMGVANSENAGGYGVKNLSFNGISSTGVITTSGTIKKPRFNLSSNTKISFVATLRQFRIPVEATLPKGFRSGDSFWVRWRDEGDNKGSLGAIKIRLDASDSGIKVTLLKAKYTDSFGDPVKYDFERHGNSYNLVSGYNNTYGYGVRDFEVEGYGRIDGFIPSSKHATISSESQGMSIRKINHNVNSSYLRGEDNYSANLKLVGLYNKINHETEKGDIFVYGGGGYSDVKRTATQANMKAYLAGAVNKVTLIAQSGNFEFKGLGAGNILKNNSKNGFTSVIAAGIGNSLTRVGNGDGNIIMLGGGNHINWNGNGDVSAKLGGATINHVTRRGDGENNFTLVGLVGNIANIYGNGNITLGGLGLANVIKKEGNGDATIVLVGGANIYHQKGSGSIKAFMLGGGNVLLKRNNGGNIYALMAGGINYIGQVGSGNLYAGMLGGANVITKFGQGDAYAAMAGGLNVLVQVGDGKTAAVMYGGLNVLTKVGNGLTIGALFGYGNVFTHVGNGNSIAAMLGGANIFTKVGGLDNDLTIAAMAGVGNIFTHIGNGSTYALMAGGANIFTKVGNGTTIAAMFSIGNIFTHIGNGTTAAIMAGKGNVLTKVGDGLTIGAMYATGNIFTHVGTGTTLALMAATGNIFTKVGNGTTIAAMLGTGNIFTHVGDGTTGAVMLGAANIMTKVGNGTTIAVMLAPPKEAKLTGANIFTHIGDGTSGALMFGGHANIFTHVGDGLSVAALIGGQANIFTHVGDGTSVALMLLAKANIFTKVGNGTSIALMQGDANIMTHVGDGLTVGLAVGKANIITKVGNAELVTGLYGKANIVTHVSSDASNTFALVKGNANIITKVGPLDGLKITVSPLDSTVSDPVAKEDRILARGDLTSNPMGVFDSVLSGMNTLVSSTYNDIVNRNGGMLSTVAIGEANIITHVGKGATNVLAHGKANIITKVGNGRSIVLANGKANILTAVGDGDSIQAANGEANIITKVGSGSSAVVAKGKANIVTKVGDGLHVGLMHGQANIQTVVGDGMAISAQNGKFNLNTRVGNGTNISVAKGKYNLNVQYGDGLGIYAAVGRGNISIKIGNGDYYGAGIALGKGSAKDTAKALLSELKGTGISVLASGTISKIVNGDDEGTVLAKQGHTIPTVKTPTSLKGISVTQKDDTTTGASSDDVSKGITKTSSTEQTSYSNKVQNTTASLAGAQITFKGTWIGYEIPVTLTLDKNFKSGNTVWVKWREKGNSGDLAGVKLQIIKNGDKVTVKMIKAKYTSYSDHNLKNYNFEKYGYSYNLTENSSDRKYGIKDFTIFDTKIKQHLSIDSKGTTFEITPTVSSNQMENDSKKESQAATDAHNNANKDKQKADQDLAKAKNKVEIEKAKVDSFKTDIEKTDTAKLQENAQDIKSFVQQQLGSSSSDYNSSSDNSPTSNKETYSAYNKTVKNGDAFRNEFAKINSDVKKHLDTYGKTAQDSVKKAKDESSKVDINKAISDSKTKYLEAKSNEQKANSDKTASQTNVQDSKNKATSAQNSADSKKTDAQNRANKASSGVANKTKSSEKEHSQTISKGFESSFKNKNNIQTNATIPTALNTNVEKDKIKEELEAGVTAINLNRRDPKHKEKAANLADKYTKAKDTINIIKETVKTYKKVKKDLSENYKINDLPAKQSGTLINFEGKHLGEPLSRENEILNLLGEKKSSLSFNSNIDSSISKYIDNKSHITDSDLTNLKISKEYMKKLSTASNIEMDYNDDSHLNFKIKSPNSDKEYLASAIWDSNEKNYTINVMNDNNNSYKAIKVFNGHKSYDIELSTQNVKNILSNVKTYNYTDEGIEIRTKLGEEYVLKKNKDTNTYSIYDEGKKLTYSEHSYIDSTNTNRLALNSTAKKNLDNINFKNVFDHIINNEIRGENAKADKLHDGLPMYLAGTLKKENIKLEVYEEIDGVYKEVLQTTNDINYAKTIKVIREGESGNYTYSVARNEQDTNNIYKSGVIEDKNNSLYIAIDSQINGFNYEKTPDGDDFKITAKESGKQSIQELRNKTAITVNSTYEKLAKDMIKEMDTGSLKLSYKDQILSVVKTVLVQHGIPYLVESGVKFLLGLAPLSPLASKYVKSVVGSLVNSVTRVFLETFVLPNPKLKPSGVQSISKTEGTIYDTVDYAAGIMAYNVVYGMTSLLNTRLDRQITDLGDIKPGSTEDIIKGLGTGGLGVLLGEGLTNISLTAMKVKLAKMGVMYKISDAEVENAIKKSLADGKALGMKIINNPDTSAEYGFLKSLTKDNFKAFGKGTALRFASKLFGTAAAEIGRTNTEVPSEGWALNKNDGIGFIQAFLINTAAFMPFMGDTYNTNYKKYVKEHGNEIDFANRMKDGIKALNKINQDTTISKQDLASINISLAGLFYEVNENMRTNINKNLVEGIHVSDGVINEKVESKLRGFATTYNDLLNSINQLKENSKVSLSLKNEIITKLNSLKTDITNIQNAIPEKESKLRTSFSNSLNLVNTLSESINNGAINGTNLVDSPFDNNKTLFDSSITANSDVSKYAYKYANEINQNGKTLAGKKIFVAVEQVYFNDKGEKVVITPHIDAPKNAEVITVRQYGNTFVLVENKKETIISGQNDANSASSNLKSLIYKNYKLDIDESSLNKTIENTKTKIANQEAIKKYVSSDISITHLENLNKIDETSITNWKDLSLTQKSLLSSDNNTPMMNYDHQIIIQMENNSTVQDSAFKLALKHSKNTTIVQMTKDGSFKVVYGKELSSIDGKVRISGVGYGRENTGEKTLGGRLVNDFTNNIKSLKDNLKTTATVDRVSIVGCNLGADPRVDSKNNDYGKNLITSLKNSGINTSVSVRNSYVGIMADGKKVTSIDGDTNWRNKNQEHKTVYSFDKDGTIVSDKQSISGDLVNAKVLDDQSNKLSIEGSNRLVSNDKGDIQDVDINKVGDSLSNNDISPTDPRGEKTKTIDNDKISDIDSKINKNLTASESEKLTQKEKSEKFDKTMEESKKAPTTTKEKAAAISGNIQVNVGDGEHTTLYYGANNIDIKIGDGGHKTAMFGDNNALVSIGHRDTNAKHTVKAGTYTAFEGAQVLIGQRNLALNYGERNDFIVMLDKSIPVIPLLNPFEGAAGISQTLKKIANSNSEEQETLWSFDRAKNFATSSSVLDVTSSVEYKTLLNVGSQNDVSNRGIKYDTEAYLNNKINGGGSQNKVDDGFKAKVKDFKNAVKESSINIGIGGRGADIMLANGNFSFLFGDNVQSALDTTVASLFGVMQQGFTRTGAPTTTFTFSPSDLQTQLGNNIKNRIAALTDDITVGELMDLVYTETGHIYSKEGRKVDAGGIIKDLFTTILGDSYTKLLETIKNPKKIINTVKEMGSTSVDMIKNTLSGLGLPVDSSSNTDEEKTTTTVPTTTGNDEVETKSFGFSRLKMPSFFDALKIPSMITKLPTLVSDLTKTLTNDVSNMKDKMLDFFTKSGYMKGDGDLVVSLGAQNFVWGGHGKDLIALLGTNNNVWAGEDDDVGYLMGEGNTFSGNNGNDSAVMMGQNHMFIGGKGDDFAVASGRYNNLFGGAGNDQLWIFGTRGLVKGGEGDDYIVATGNNADINAGIGNDFSVTMGSGNKVYLEAGDDQAKLFGNKNKLVAGEGKDTLDIYSYDSIIEAGADNDTIMARSKSKNNKIYAGKGDDTLFIGGYKNEYRGGEGKDIFVLTKQNIEGEIKDIEAKDMIVFNNFSYKNLWFEKSSNDLLIHTYNKTESVKTNTQQWFEEYGAVKVNDYFSSNEKKAAIVTSVKKDSNGNVVSYEYLDNNAFSKLIEVMATADKTKGADGFMTNQSDKFKNDVALSWSQRKEQTTNVA